jgi:F-type H+-transporting ATPase subunit b
MLNGWFTIAAQAFNFLILVWLLKRFLYKPILDAIDQREKGIAAQLASGVAKTAEAQKERDDLQHKNEAFDQERASLLTKASDEAKAQGQKLLDQAKTDSDALRAKRQADLETEQQHLNQDIRRWTQQQVFAVARKALTDLSGASLDARMGDVFVERIRALQGPAKEELATAFKTSNPTISVHSAFDLPAAQQGAITSAVTETFAPDAHVQFETAPELIGGIELSANGHKIAWSIADYLATLEKSAGDLVHAQADPQPKADAKPAPDLKSQAKPEANGGAKPGPKPNGKPAAEPVPATAGADH